MQRSERTKRLLFAIAVGTVSGAVLGTLVGGTLYFLSDGTAAARSDSLVAFAVTIAGCALGGAFHGWAASTES